MLAERESRICTSMYSSGLFPISSGIITWNMHDGEPTTCTKFINLHKKSRQNLRQQICRKAPFTSIQSDPDQNQAWPGCVGKKWWDKIRNRTLFIVPQWMGHSIWLSIPSCQWSHIRLWSYMMNTVPSDNKTPNGRIKCDSHHETKSTLLALLQTRSHKGNLNWSVDKINWICLWTGSCCQSKIEESRFQSWIASNTYLTSWCIPDASAAAWTKDGEKMCYLLYPCFGRSR